MIRQPFLLLPPSTALGTHSCHIINAAQTAIPRPFCISKTIIIPRQSFSFISSDELWNQQVCHKATSPFINSGSCGDVSVDGDFRLAENKFSRLFRCFADKLVERCGFWKADFRNQRELHSFLYSSIRQFLQRSTLSIGNHW